MQIIFFVANEFKISESPSSQKLSGVVRPLRGPPGPSGATRRAEPFGKLSLATLAAHVVPAGPLATLAALAVLQVPQALLFSSSVPREWWGGAKVASPPP